MSNSLARPSQRQHDQLRKISFQRQFTQHAAGSVLVSFGDTRVLCTASISDGVPRFLKDQGRGWLTAEYSMLPSATHERCQREAARGKQTGRTIEIQRLIGRSLRAAIDLEQLGEYTITIDCDVLQADGGTRTAAISGAYVALHDAVHSLLEQKKITSNPLLAMVAAVSVGIYEQHAVLDLDYAEDCTAHTDMNVIMNQHQQFIEVQGTAEGAVLERTQLDQLLDLASHGIGQIIAAQQAALNT